MDCKFWFVTTNFFSVWTLWNEIFCGVRENLSPIKSAFITSLNFPIISLSDSLSKNLVSEEILMFPLESCAKKQI